MSDSFKSRLTQFGQSQLLRWVDELSPAAQQQLFEQIDSIDFRQLQSLVAGEDLAVDWAALSAKALPPPAVRLGQADARFSESEARAAGEKALKQGEVAMLLVAGGQGTRLGFDLPRRHVSHRTGQWAHSVSNGLRSIDRHEPSLWSQHSAVHHDQSCHRCRDSRLLSERRGLWTGRRPTELFLPRPDARCRCQDWASAPGSERRNRAQPRWPWRHCHGLGQIRLPGRCQGARGIKLFYYAQIDNPLAEICDPVLIGYHLLGKSELTTQVVKKRFAKEKVGNVVSIDGKVQIIEYSDLPDAVAEQTTASGDLQLWAGNIAIHVFDLAFLEKSPPARQMACPSIAPRKRLATSMLVAIPLRQPNQTRRSLNALSSTCCRWLPTRWLSKPMPAMSLPP